MFDDATGQPIVGNSAVNRMISHPNDVVYSVKRFMGTTFNDKWVRQDQENVTYKVQETQQHKVVIHVADRELTPTQVSAEVLRKLKNDAEIALGGQKITQAVITVPAYFNEAQRHATKEAGELAGLQVPRIINEPTASALAFGLGSKPQTVAVYDLGGGTFDISILRIEHGLFRVKATGGDTHLGGDDFDLAIVKWMKEAFKEEHGVDLPDADDDRLRALLREEAEKAKIAMTTATETPIHIPNVLTVKSESLGLDSILTSTIFEEQIQPFIDRSLMICNSVLKKAEMRTEEIDQVLLVGGQTRTPAVHRAIKNHFGWVLNTSVNPDEAVAKGAAILGARLCGYLKEQVKLWDVVPLSLGIELADGKMEPILHANEQIPVTVWRKGSQAFTTQHDGQERIRFRIFQGEQPIATENVLIGEVTLTLTTARAAGEPRINCMFKVDHDGILHVRAEDADTESEPVEEMFDHMYNKKQEEIDQKTS